MDKNLKQQPNSVFKSIFIIDPVKGERLQLAKLLKQENQRLQKIVEQIKTWVPQGFHMQLGIADKKEN